MITYLIIIVRVIMVLLAVTAIVPISSLRLNSSGQCFLSPIAGKMFRFLVMDSNTHQFLGTVRVTYFPLIADVPCIKSLNRTISLQYTETVLKTVFLLINEVLVWRNQ